MRESNFDSRNETLAAHASFPQRVAAPESSVAIRFHAGHEDEGFGVLVESGEQFYSGDEDVFTVRASQIALLRDKRVPFSYVSEG